MVAQATSHKRIGYSPNISLAIGSLCLSLVIFLLIRAEVQKANEALDIARAQLVALPVYLLSIYIMTRSWLRKAWIFVCLPIVCAICAGFYSGVSYTGSTERAYIGMLEGDIFGSSTQILYDAIDSQSKKMSTHVRYSRPSKKIDAKQVKGMFADSPKLSAIISGDSQWISLDLAPSALLTLSKAEWIEKFGELQIITSVPHIGISFQPISDTARFIVSLLEDSEASLLLSGNIEAAWSAGSHRALPYMMLGVQALRDALATRQYQPPVMDCAADNFYKAWLLSSMKDNPELKAAVTNNLGVVWFIQGVLEDSKALRQKGLDSLMTASAYRRQLEKNDGLYYAPLVATENVKLIRKVRIQESLIRESQRERDEDSEDGVAAEQ